MQVPRIDFESGGGAQNTANLHQFLGLGYISCIQKVLFSEKLGGHGQGRRENSEAKGQKR